MILETADLFENFALRTGGTGKVGEMGPRFSPSELCMACLFFFFSFSPGVKNRLV